MFGRGGRGVGNDSDYNIDINYKMYESDTNI